MKTVDVNELENIKGQDLGHSDWMAIEQDRINQFADATGDHQWIHLDAEKAANNIIKNKLSVKELSGISASKKTTPKKCKKKISNS